MYKPLTFENADRIKYVLLNTQLVNSVKIQKNPNVVFNADAVSDNWVESDYGNDEFFMMNGDSTDPLIINGKSYTLSLKVGWWRDTYRIPNTHITLGSSYSKYGSFFSQIELSQAIEDDDKIYIIKNMSKLAGDGTMARLNNGLKDKNSKIGRRYDLAKRLDKEIINYECHEWLVVDKIKKSDLLNEDNHGYIFQSFMENFINYALTVEEIIA